jgi:hypothetical protein
VTENSPHDLTQEKNMRMHKQQIQKSTPHSHPGYILIFALLMLSTLVAIATYSMTRGSIYVPFARAQEFREQAKLIARGGLEIAIAQLAHVHKEPEKKSNDDTQNAENKPQSNPLQESKLFLTHFLPTINRWQEYKLTEEVDGINAMVRICLMCEEGKININQIYDYDKKTFIGKGKPQGDWYALMQELCKQIEQKQGGTDLFKALETFLKKRPYKLIDVTELLHIKEFASFRNHQFYMPPTEAINKENKQPLYLTDLFTVESRKRTVNPWVFSNALLGLLGLEQAAYGDTQKRREQSEEWFKQFNRTKNWKDDWSLLLEPIYHKELASLPKNIETIFDTSADPRLFSVLSEGHVGTITQQLFAIVERTKKSEKKGKTSYTITVKKLYWL